MSRTLANHKGLTLIELLVVIAVFSILFVAIAMFVVPTMNLFVKTREIAEATSMANLTMDYIEGSVYSTDVLELRTYSAALSTVSDAAYDTGTAAPYGDRQFYLLSTNDARAGALELYKEGDAARSDAVSSGITAGYQADIAFSTPRAGSKVLTVTVEVAKADGGDPLYTLTKDIYLTNLLDTAVNGTAGEFYQELLFYRPDGSEKLTP